MRSIGFNQITLNPKRRQGVGVFDTSKCYSFQVDESIELPNTGIQFQKEDPFTIMMRVKMGTATFHEMLFAYTNGSATGYRLQRFAHGYLRVEFYCGVGTMLANSNYNTINNNTWTHIGLTYNGGSSSTGFKFYINGVDNGVLPNANIGVLGTTTYTGFTTPLLGALGGSAAFSRGAFYNGFMDDFVILPIELTQAQVATYVPYSDYALLPTHSSVNRWQRAGEIDTNGPFVSVESKNSYNGTPNNMTFIDNIVPI